MDFETWVTHDFSMRRPSQRRTFPCIAPTSMPSAMFLVGAAAALLLAASTDAALPPCFQCAKLGAVRPRQQSLTLTHLFFCAGVTRALAAWDRAAGPLRAQPCRPAPAPRMVSPARRVATCGCFPVWLHGAALKHTHTLTAHPHPTPINRRPVILFRTRPPHTTAPTRGLAQERARPHPPRGTCSHRQQRACHELVRRNHGQRTPLSLSAHPASLNILSLPLSMFFERDAPAIT